MSDLDAWLARQGEEYTGKLRAKKPRATSGAAPKKHSTPERDAQKAVVAWLEKAGCVVWAAPNEAPNNTRKNDPDAEKKRARFYAARRRAGIRPGAPDLTVVTQGGRVFFIEMKSATGTTSDKQDKFHDELRARGQVVIVGRDIWSVQQGIEAAGIVLSWRTARAEPPR